MGFLSLAVLAGACAGSCHGILSQANTEAADIPATRYGKMERSIFPFRQGFIVKACIN